MGNKRLLLDAENLRKVFDFVLDIEMDACEI
jgi:hypothetical protein